MRWAVAVGLAAALTSVLAAATLARVDAPKAVPPVEEDYVLHCSACHGADGAGVPGRVPGLESVAELAGLPGGRDYLMRVPGAAQSPLDDARLARLIGWIAVRFGGAEIVPPLSPEDVGRARLTPLRDPETVRAALFEAR